MVKQVDKYYSHCSVQGIFSYALVMPTLTHYHPNQAVKIDERELHKGIQLAEPTYGLALLTLFYEPT